MSSWSNGDHIGGTCGYGEYGRTVNDGSVTGVSKLYKNATGCGACYQVTLQTSFLTHQIHCWCRSLSHQLIEENINILIF